PHFVIAVARKWGAGKPCVLRATIDSDILAQQIRSLNIEPPSEAFLINREGVLQTPSRNQGNLLEKSHVDVPPYSEQWVVREAGGSSGKTSILGYAYINSSPFILIIIKYPATSLANWFNLKRGLWLFLIFSMIVTVLIIMTMATYMVSRIREADSHRAMVLHKVEYQAKMASLGRMAAGVAHEINNPMAIINEKAGMLKDIATFKDDFSYKDKTLQLVDSILHSVERCSRITHRLLGFAKYIDVKIEAIDMDILVKEVIGFLEVEANYRNIEIKVDVLDDNIPTIKSDRGQLQQVLLNMLNNSLNALAESGRDGRILITLNSEGPDHVSVTIEDNGPGISKENLTHIFEPFYTTRSNGTGLGLSITYGIVEKLGGQIETKSEVGVGTSFKVTLPVKKQNSGSGS
ncbi:MAG: ATP-binding protein, partial [Actinobacteria bacterium]|nr:ATP-binding protein [Actinomycetota bacterium]